MDISFKLTIQLTICSMIILEDVRLASFFWVVHMVGCSGQDIDQRPKTDLRVMNTLPAFTVIYGLRVRIP